MTTPPSPARQFLRSNPVPPGPSRAFDEWVDRCRQLGPESATDLLDALKHGDNGEQYGAVIALRLIGFEVWAEGCDDELIYKVKAPNQDESTTIEPAQR